ncbi:dTDP-4-dehydrorhamnose reductase/dTDP-4-dehydrorhamnose 3,5-epimerase [Arthrobacter sp. 754]
MEFQKRLAAKGTSIPGMLLFDLPVHGDNRGWFKENWQRKKMMELGLPDFSPVQNNISFNDKAGTTRGIHAEPWDKFVSVATGRIFCAWVDLREGPSFGAQFTTELDPGQAIYIPRGVANSYQTLEANTSYVYLVNDHWSPETAYTFVNLSDPSLGIDWPIPLDRAEVSEKDLGHPMLAEVAPIPPRKILLIGGHGQLGLALQEVFDGDSRLEVADRTTVDLGKPESLLEIAWRQYDTIINAAAYTAVDKAETPEGRAESWAVNATGVAALAKIAAEHGILLVHVSSDYVFDGRVEEHDEDEPFTPLGVYGQSKGAGDTVVGSLARHYIVRTSWVIGEGNNFVRTMASLASRGVKPAVVNDQFGRLTFTADLAAGIKHLVAVSAPYGTYNLSNTGSVASWAEIAADVFEIVGADRDSVTGVSTEDYFAGKQAAPRPRHSTLKLDKLESAGFSPADWRSRLKAYLCP